MNEPTTFINNNSFILKMSTLHFVPLEKLNQLSYLLFQKW